MKTEDGDIIYKCLNGDSAAFGLLVDKYKESIYALAYSRLQNFHDAEDVTQEVFINAYQKLKTLRRWDSFLGWLYSITSNLCKMHVRSQSRKPKSEPIEGMELYDKDWGVRHREESLDASLHEALNSLPEIYQQVLTLYYLGGMSIAEISKFLGVSISAIKERLSRARAQMREEMLEMMSNTFAQQKLRAGFTFRIVEAVKKIKINPMTNTRGLPWGVSLATGIMFVIMSINPHISQMIVPNIQASSPLPSESKVLKAGEIPVSVLETAELPFISNAKGNDNGKKTKKPNEQEDLMMAPKVEGDTWAKKADMPTARWALGSATVDGKIYCIGGSPDDIDVFSIVEEYDPKTDTWAKKASMPTARGGLAVCELNGKIYAIGGWEKGYIASSKVEEYDPTKDKWTRKAEMPTARGVLSTSVANGKIYAIGGYNFSNLLATVEEYDPSKDEWEKKAAMPTARDRLGTCTLDGKIYAIGGATRGAAQLAVADVEVYDPATDTWIKKNDMSVARGGLSVTIINDKIFAIGGFSGLNPYSLVEEYDSQTDTWAKRSNMPFARVLMTSDVIDDKIYLIGGYAPELNLLEYTNLTEEYIPGKSAFGVFLKGKLPSRWGEAKK